MEKWFNIMYWYRKYRPIMHGTIRLIIQKYLLFRRWRLTFMGREEIAAGVVLHYTHEVLDDESSRQEWWKNNSFRFHSGIRI